MQRATGDFAEKTAGVDPADLERFDQAVHTIYTIVKHRQGAPLRDPDQVLASCLDGGRADAPSGDADGLAVELEIRAALEALLSHAEVGLQDRLANGLHCQRERFHRVTRAYRRHASVVQADREKEAREREEAQRDLAECKARVAELEAEVAATSAALDEAGQGFAVPEEDASLGTMAPEAVASRLSLATAFDEGRLRQEWANAEAERERLRAWESELRAWERRLRSGEECLGLESSFEPGQLADDAFAVKEGGEAGGVLHDAPQEKIEEDRPSLPPRALAIASEPKRAAAGTGGSDTPTNIAMERVKGLARTILSRMLEPKDCQS